MTARGLLPRFTMRNVTLLLLDVLLIILSIYAALLLRFDVPIPPDNLEAFYALIPLFSILGLLANLASRLYDRVWQYASLGEMFAILKAVTITMLVAVFLIFMLDLPQLPRSVYILSWVLMICSIGASRLFWRLARPGTVWNGKQGHNTSRVLIVGAGDAGAMLQQELERNVKLGMKVVAFVDDSKNKKDSLLHGVPVVGGRGVIERAVREYNVDEIVIAMPSVAGSELRSIVDICNHTGVRVRILPGTFQNASELVRGLRSVQMEDLLRREPVQRDIHQISRYIKDKVVMVTGAGGSIGSELCRQLACLEPKQLLLVENSENNLFEIDLELRKTFKLVEPVLDDVRRYDAMEQVFARYHPQVIFHAAAFKHVPMMEIHPQAAFENNVIGTRNMAALADKFGAETFVLVSTDKAVNPTSIMGATKRLAELVAKDISRNSKTIFAAVRFGNVLGSRGSVIPLFLKQIEEGGPVTVTDPEMRRFFMTIPEAVQLIIQAGALARGGEIFVLDMGEMVKIDDMARDLIRLSGFEPDQDIKIVYTGIRPGEKMYEELFKDLKGLVETSHERIFVHSHEIAEELWGFSEKMRERYQRSFASDAEVVALIEQCLPEYQGDWSKR